MIPRIIHYCWFGGNPLPKSAIKCINSWKRHFPDYEIKEWNESNFDVNLMTFTTEAYKDRKYAFVSDVARFWILYHEGGLYFDTDVEVLKSFDDILEQGAFLGVETPAVEGRKHPTVNPGLGLGADAGNSVLKEVLEYYETLHYCDQDGLKIDGTVVTHTTEVMKRLGMQMSNQIQHISDITVYPRDYFNPLEDATGVLTKTENTHSIHWYSKTWVDNYGPVRLWVTRVIHRLFGIDSMLWLKRIIKI